MVMILDFEGKTLNRESTVKVGLLGGIRSGKDTVATVIEQQLSGEVERFAFSGGIHEVIKEFLPTLYQKGKPRLALQEIGQLMRKFDPNVWINRLFYRIETSSNVPLQDRNIIITDVRQYNEALRLKEAGYTIIKVVADMDVRLERARKAGDNFSKEMFEHETEQSIDVCPYDYLIDNSGTLEQLEERVKDVLREMSGGRSDG